MQTIFDFQRYNVNEFSSVSVSITMLLVSATELSAAALMLLSSFPTGVAKVVAALPFSLGCISVAKDNIVCCAYTRNVGIVRGNVARVAHGSSSGCERHVTGICHDNLSTRIRHFIFGFFRPDFGLLRRST